jgi:TIGR03009 family protein
MAITLPAWAQTQPMRGPEPTNGIGEPDQPVYPRNPELVPRTQQQPGQQYGQQPGQSMQGPDQGQQQFMHGQQLPGQGRQPVRQAPPEPPFRLSPQQEAQVNHILDLWEKRNQKVKTFDCKFKRWVYDSVFGQQGVPKFVELGTIKFQSPDKGIFRLESSEKDGKLSPIEDSRALHWMCDGKSIWEYSPTKKQVIEYRLPPEAQGKAIARTPLPFLFGSSAQELKTRYFIRVLPPPDNSQDKICLEAYPRYQEDAGNFKSAKFIITARDLNPFALMLVDTNGKDYTAYQFYDIVMNDNWVIFKSDPFRVFIPRGWQLIPDDHATQAVRLPSNGRR